MALKKAGLLYFAILFTTFIGYIAVKLNTNLLTVSDFGRYSFFIATITFSQTFLSLGLFESTSRQLAIEKDTFRVRKLQGTLHLLTLFLGILFILFIWVWAPFSDLFFEIKIGSLLTVLSPLVFVILFQNMLLITLRGSGEIKKLSWFTFAPRLIYVIVLIFLVFTDSFTLNSTSLSFLLSILFVDFIFIILAKPIFADFKENIALLFSEIKTFGHHLFVANIAGMLIFYTDKFMLAHFLDADQLAFYVLAFTLAVPLAHFSSALSRTMYKEFANQPRIDPHLLKLNMIIILTLASFLIIFRKFIVLELFSPDFEPAINVLVILVIAFSFVGLAAPYTMFFKAQRRGKEVRNITLCVGILLLALSIILIPIMGINGAALAVLAAYGFDYISYIWFYRRYLIRTN
jgi:O-antigen/teichoic acid export membrane protein